MPDQNSIIDLQIKTTYLEKSIDDLNKIIIQQQKQIDELEKKLLEVEDRVKSNDHSEIINPPPPHH